MVDWTILYSVELVTFILTLLLTLYIIFNSYRYLSENGLIYLHILIAYPSFWQALGATLGLVYYTREYLDVWFILNIFFEILGTAFTLVYMNRILKQFFRKADISYSVFNYSILFICLAGVILCLVGLIQIRYTFIYYQAGAAVLTGSFVILQIITIMNFFRMPYKKFFALIFIANCFLIANGAYFIYLAFKNYMIFQFANYILFIVLNFVAKFVCLGLSQFIVSDLVTLGK